MIYCQYSIYININLTDGCITAPLTITWAVNQYYVKLWRRLFVSIYYNYKL